MKSKECNGVFREPIAGKFHTEEEISLAMGQAVREALLRHKRIGNPVAVWKDGKVVIVQPEDIDLSVFDEPAAKSAE